MNASVDLVLTVIPKQEMRIKLVMLIPAIDEIGYPIAMPSPFVSHVDRPSLSNRAISILLCLSSTVYCVAWLFCPSL